MNDYIFVFDDPDHHKNVGFCTWPGFWFFSLQFNMILLLFKYVLVTLENTSRTLYNCRLMANLTTCICCWCFYFLTLPAQRCSAFSSTVIFILVTTFTWTKPTLIPAVSTAVSDWYDSLCCCSGLSDLEKKEEKNNMSTCCWKQT